MKRTNMINPIKYIIIPALLLYGNISIYSQAGYAIFAPQHQSKAYLYKNATSHQVVDSIVNDSIEEIFYCVSINRSACKRALISTFVDEDLLKKHSGWIEWENLGVRLNCCDTVYIREKPNSKANVVGFYYMAAWLYVYPIMKAKNGWLYMYDKGRNIKGWVAPNAQCINSYTTCN